MNKSIYSPWIPLFYLAISVSIGFVFALLFLLLPYAYWRIGIGSVPGFISLFLGYGNPKTPMQIILVLATFWAYYCLFMLPGFFYYLLGSMAKHDISKAQILCIKWQKALLRVHLFILFCTTACVLIAYYVIEVIGLE